MTPPPCNHRIAFVCSQLPLGGSTTFLCNLAGELTRRGIPTRVFSFASNRELAADFAAKGVDVADQDAGAEIFEDRMRSVVSNLRAFGATVVVSCLGPESFEVLRYLPAEVWRIGMVQSDDARVYAMVSRYASVLNQTAGVSNLIREKLGQALPSVPSVYLPYGVPFTSFGEPARLPDDNPLRIIFLGRVHREQKRAHLFPRFVAELKESKIPFSFTIAGDGDLLVDLKQTISSDNTNQRVIFTGKVSYTDVPALLRENDVYFLMSDYEGLPLSLLEAMGEGLVPVTSDLPGGIREVVDSTCGLLVNPAEIEGYSRAIQWLHHDRQAMAKMAEQSQRRARSLYSVEAMADRWVHCFPTQVAAAKWTTGKIKMAAPLNARIALYYQEPIRTLRKVFKRLSG